MSSWRLLRDQQRLQAADMRPSLDLEVEDEIREHARREGRARILALRDLVSAVLDGRADSAALVDALAALAADVTDAAREIDEARHAHPDDGRLGAAEAAYLHLQSALEQMQSQAAGPHTVSLVGALTAVEQAVEEVEAQIALQENGGPAA